MGESRDENLVMTFPVKKRINTELIIDKVATLFTLNGDRKNEN